MKTKVLSIPRPVSGYFSLDFKSKVARVCERALWVPFYRGLKSLVDEFNHTYKNLNASAELRLRGGTIHKLLRLEGGRDQVLPQLDDLDFMIVLKGQNTAFYIQNFLRSSAKSVTMFHDAFGHHFSFRHQDTVFGEHYELKQPMGIKVGVSVVYDENALARMADCYANSGYVAYTDRLEWGSLLGDSVRAISDFDSGVFDHPEPECVHRLWMRMVRFERKHQRPVEDQMDKVGFDAIFVNFGFLTHELRVHMRHHYDDVTQHMDWDPFYEDMACLVGRVKRHAFGVKGQEQLMVSELYRIISTVVYQHFRVNEATVRSSIDAYLKDVEARYKAFDSDGSVSSGEDTESLGFSSASSSGDTHDLMSPVSPAQSSRREDPLFQYKANTMEELASILPELAREDSKAARYRLYRLLGFSEMDQHVLVGRTESQVFPDKLRVLNRQLLDVYRGIDDPRIARNMQRMWVKTGLWETAYLSVKQSNRLMLLDFTKSLFLWGMFWKEGGDEYRNTVMGDMLSVLDDVGTEPMTSQQVDKFVDDKLSHLILYMDSSNVNCSVSTLRIPPAKPIRKFLEKLPSILNRYRIVKRVIGVDLLSRDWISDLTIEELDYSHVVAIMTFCERFPELMNYDAASSMLKALRTNAPLVDDDGVFWVWVKSFISSDFVDEWSKNQFKIRLLEVHDWDVANTCKILGWIDDPSEQVAFVVRERPARVDDVFMASFGQYVDPGFSVMHSKLSAMTRFNFGQSKAVVLDMGREMRQAFDSDFGTDDDIRLQPSLFLERLDFFLDLIRRHGVSSFKSLHFEYIHQLDRFVSAIRGVQPSELKKHFRLVTEFGRLGIEGVALDSVGPQLQYYFWAGLSQAPSILQVLDHYGDHVPDSFRDDVVMRLLQDSYSDSDFVKVARYLRDFSGENDLLMAVRTLVEDRDIRVAQGVIQLICKHQPEVSTRMILEWMESGDLVAYDMCDYATEVREFVAKIRETEGYVNRYLRATTFCETGGHVERIRVVHSEVLSGVEELEDEPVNASLTSRVMRFFLAFRRALGADRYRHFVRSYEDVITSVGGDIYQLIPRPVEREDRRDEGTSEIEPLSSFQLLTRLQQGDSLKSLGLAVIDFSQGYVTRLVSGLKEDSDRDCEIFDELVAQLPPYMWRQKDKLGFDARAQLIREGKKAFLNRLFVQKPDYALTEAGEVNPVVFFAISSMDEDILSHFLRSEILNTRYRINARALVYMSSYRNSLLVKRTNDSSMRFEFTTPVAQLSHLIGDFGPAYEDKVIPFIRKMILRFMDCGVDLLMLGAGERSSISNFLLTQLETLAGEHRSNALRSVFPDMLAHPRFFESVDFSRKISVPVQEVEGQEVTMVWRDYYVDDVISALDTAIDFVPKEPLFGKFVEFLGAHPEHIEAYVAGRTQAPEGLTVMNRLLSRAKEVVRSFKNEEAGVFYDQISTLMEACFQAGISIFDERHNFSLSLLDVCNLIFFHQFKYSGHFLDEALSYLERNPDFFKELTRTKNWSNKCLLDFRELPLLVVLCGYFDWARVTRVVELIQTRGFTLTLDNVAERLLARCEANPASFEASLREALEPGGKGVPMLEWLKEHEKTELFDRFYGLVCRSGVEAEVLQRHPSLGGERVL